MDFLRCYLAVRLHEKRGRWLRGGAEFVGLDEWPQCSCEGPR